MDRCERWVRKDRMKIKRLHARFWEGELRILWEYKGFICYRDWTRIFDPVYWGKTPEKDSNGNPMLVAVGVTWEELERDIDKKLGSEARTWRKYKEVPPSVRDWVEGEAT